MKSPGTPLAIAFARTCYRVHLPEGPCDVRVGELAPAVDAWCQHVGATSWAIITAVNPGATAIADADNVRRQEVLWDDLVALNIVRCAAENIDPCGEWPTEPSVCIAGGTPALVLALAIRHAQLAVVMTECGQTAALIWTPAGEATLKFGQ